MQRRHPLHGTPQGRRQIIAINARLRSKLNHKTPPSEQIKAWIEYRLEMYIEPGLEGRKGADATYHLEYDVPRLLWQAVQQLTCQGPNVLLPSPLKRPRAALGHLSKAYGFRYLRGVDGIRIALIEASATKEQIAIFLAERDAFATKFIKMADVAWVLNKKGEEPNAVWAALVVFVEETERLCYWLSAAGQSSIGLMLRSELEDVHLAMRGG